MQINFGLMFKMPYLRYALTYNYGGMYYVYGAAVYWKKKAYEKRRNKTFSYVVKKVKNIK